ncbi:MAG: hypothetical protein IKA84_03175 [Clostridia bacterium]|nr:hypothetical protein [Clostridia bacterium]
MDFTLIQKIEVHGMRYKLMRSNFCRGYYVIIIQSKNDFSCESFASNDKESALDLFYEIAASATEPCSLRGIIMDNEKLLLLANKS